MKIRILLLLLLMFSLSACRRALASNLDTDDEDVLSEEQIVSGGVTRHFLLHVPPSYNGLPIPLVINFHGLGSNSKEQAALTGMSAKADEAGFIVVYPDGVDQVWHTGPGAEGEADLQFIRDLIARLENLYSINPKQIYATGISNGGGMTNRLACDLSDVVAAIAPDSGAYNFWETCNPIRPVPVIAFHGLNDNIVPYEGGAQRIMEPPIEEWASAWAVRNQCNPNPEINSPVESVTTHHWSNCKNNADVILYTLANHGHSWPGSPTLPRAITSQAINATDLIWDFFSTHPMP
ncbi:MAG: PHB depolymerase family esterase [Anaerolineales bacterium]